MTPCFRALSAARVAIARLELVSAGTTNEYRLVRDDEATVERMAKAACAIYGYAGPNASTRALARVMLDAALTAAQGGEDG